MKKPLLTVSLALGSLFALSLSQSSSKSAPKNTTGGSGAAQSVHAERRL